MKIIAKYHGKVIELKQPPYPSRVTLQEIEILTGNKKISKPVETNVASETLVSKNLSANDEFEIIIQEFENGIKSGEIHKINTTQFEFNF